MDAAAAIAGVQAVQEAFKVLTPLYLFAALWPINANVFDGAKYDFIIVGAGTAGSVLANRLTEDNTTRVLLVESGGDPPIESVRPGLFSFLSQSRVDWNYTSEDDGFTERFHRNKVVEVVRGKMLGGCSSLNFMLYTRGNYHDYDGWARIANDSSWSYEHVLPYFKKSEKLLSKSILTSKYKKFHGLNGYMKVTKPRYEILDDYLNAFKEVGNEIVEDTNGKNPLGYTELSFNIADGKRQSTALCFLSTAKDRKNLHVLKNALVTKIIFDKNKKAVGTKIYLGNNKTIVDFARKEVIVSAGAFNTPQLLMLSGIGPKNQLKKHKIPVIADLPVGQTLIDHTFVMTIHKMRPLEKVLIPSIDPDEFPVPFILGYTALNKSQGFPDYQTFNIVSDAQKILSFCLYFSYSNELCQELYDRGKGFELLYNIVVLIRPKSRGKVLLRSSNPLEPPRIYTGYYSNSVDIDNHAKYLQHYLNIYKSELFTNSRAEFLIPKTCGCFQSNTAEFFKCYVLCMEGSGYHFVGSAAMPTVVDSRLRVNGVKNLRVVDACIMPKTTGGNPHAPIVMIGEVAADMIKEDHGTSKNVLCQK